MALQQFELFPKDTGHFSFILSILQQALRRLFQLTGVGLTIDRFIVRDVKGASVDVVENTLTAVIAWVQAYETIDLTTLHIVLSALNIASIFSDHLSNLIEMLNGVVIFKLMNCNKGIVSRILLCTVGRTSNFEYQSLHQIIANLQQEAFKDLQNGHMGHFKTSLRKSLILSHVCSLDNRFSIKGLCALGYVSLSEFNWNEALRAFRPMSILAFSQGHRLGQIWGISGVAYSLAKGQNLPASAKAIQYLDRLGPIEEQNELLVATLCRAELMLQNKEYAQCIVQAERVFKIILDQTRTIIWKSAITYLGFVSIAIRLWKESRRNDSTIKMNKDLGELSKQLAECVDKLSSEFPFMKTPLHFMWGDFYIANQNYELADQHLAQASKSGLISWMRVAEEMKDELHNCRIVNSRIVSV